MLTTCFFAAGALVLVVLLVSAALAFGLRESVGKSVPPRLAARVLASPPCLELTVTVEPNGAAVRVERVSLPKELVDKVGVLPPAGWRIVSDPLPVRSEFEPDLEELAERSPSPTELEIEDETDRQFEELSARLQQRRRETVSFAGRLVVRRGETAALALPVATVEPVAGCWSILYSQRAGVWRFMSGTSGELRTQP